MPPYHMFGRHRALLESPVRLPRLQAVFDLPAYPSDGRLVFVSIDCFRPPSFATDIQDFPPDRATTSTLAPRASMSSCSISVY